MKHLCIYIILFFSLAVGFQTLQIQETPIIQTQSKIVSEGDTMWDIAAQISTPKQDIRRVIEEIRSLNRMAGGTTIYPGQSLVVPVYKNIEIAQR